MRAELQSVISGSLAAILLAPGASSAQAPGSTRIELPYSTTIEVPWSWRSPLPQVEQALRSERKTLRTIDLLPDEDGTWLAVAAPLADTGEEASITLTIMPSNLSQAELVALSRSAIEAADERYFRPEATRAAANNGYKLTSWEGTRRTMVGGKHALVTRYTVQWPDGPPLRKATYSIYLGSRTINVHTFASTTSGTDRANAVATILASLLVGVDSLSANNGTLPR